MCFQSKSAILIIDMLNDFFKSPTMEPKKKILTDNLNDLIN